MTKIDNSPPCDQCRAACCTRPGHAALVYLHEDEIGQFPEAIHVPSRHEPEKMMLPVNAQGRCIFLGDDNRCRIYERRPRACREFNCLYSYRLGKNRHGFFLEDHPDVVQLIETLRPAFAESRILEQRQRPEI